MSLKIKNFTTNMKNKIATLENLKILRKKNLNKKIVLAHGTFDFFHYGHLEHLKKSKDFGDILVVSITADKYIKKGIGRPIYKQDQRLKFISSLDFVDYVVAINSTSGIEIINCLKPDIYSKGYEYKNKNNDFTRKILVEEKEVKKNKGKIFYTNEMVLSSSNLINRMKFTEKGLNEKFRESFKKLNDFYFFLKKFNEIQDKNILVIGDSIIDEYIFTTALAKSPKEEIISVKEEEKNIYFGGIFATANNISTLLTLIGNEKGLEKKIKKKLNKNLDYYFCINENTKTTTKTRYLDNSHKKLFQTNKLNFSLIDPIIEKKILKFLKKTIKNYDLVVVNDFGHGLLTPKIIKVLESQSKKLCINVQTNSANFGFNFFDKYKKCYYLSLDEPEVRYALKDRDNNIKILVKKMLKKTKAQIIAVTYGANGTKMFSNNKIASLPAFSKNVVDTLGAGDAFFAISSIYSMCDNNSKNIGFVGNLAGAMKIQYLGHERHIERDDLIGYMKSFLA